MPCLVWGGGAATAAAPLINPRLSVTGLTCDPGDGDAPELRVREPHEEGAGGAVGQHLLGLLLPDEAEYVAVVPGPLEMFPRELHHRVEPLPEGEIPLGEGLLAELGPAQQEIRKVLAAGGAAPEGLVREEAQVVLGEEAARRRVELDVEGLGDLAPGHLVRDRERHSARLRESVVPGDGRPGVWLLVPVHYHHHRQTQRPDLMQQSLAPLCILLYPSLS
jgi:hypothetical protein